MNYILKCFKPSKYYGCNKLCYAEFNLLSEIIKYIVNNEIKDFTIYEKCDKFEYEEEKND